MVTGGDRIGAETAPLRRSGPNDKKGTKGTPSKTDIAMTREIQNAAKALHIELHDHLVIGHGRHVSFRAEGLL
jgi:hypothetical protein